MKRFLSIIVMSWLFTGMTYAQPSITYDHAPKIGDVYHEAFFSTPVDPGPGGANQTWNYGDVPADSTGQMEMISPSGTPFENSFPEANIVSYIVNGYGQVYGYGNLSSAEFLSWGSGVIADTGNVIMHYIDPEKQMAFPFSYQDSFTDDFYSSFEAMGMTIHRRGTSTVTADAWGSITTPETTYNSVLRVKNETNSVDSVWMGNIFILTMTSGSEDYSWYTGDYGFPVFTLTISGGERSSDTIGSYKTLAQSIGENGNNLQNIQVYPNPATDELFVSIPSSNEGDFNISLIDLTGKELIRKNSDFNIQNNVVQLNLNGISPGMYFLRINNGQNTFTKKVIVE
ncbi:MAG TPA: T9SS type A sorting domain-containing protein [Bacteroidetes bacterium]|nr:T9SS type A sorting domain-containing protein [Bacteroidota bacterium]